MLVHDFQDLKERPCDGGGDPAFLHSTALCQQSLQQVTAPAVLHHQIVVVQVCEPFEELRHVVQLSAAVQFTSAQGPGHVLVTKSFSR